MKECLFKYLFLISFFSLSQNDSLKLIGNKSFKNYPFQQIQLNEEGHFFVLTPSHFLKLTKNFDTLLSFSYAEYQEINSFQAFSLSHFLFSQQSQKTIILSRFLTKKSEIIVSSEISNFIELACISNDQHLWFIENYQLKKYNYQTHRLVFENSLIYNIQDFDENTLLKTLAFHNNLLFLHTNKGFYLFDNLGNFNYFIPAKTNSFNFLENELYFIQDQKIILYNIFLHEKKVIPFEKENIEFCQMSNEKVYLFDTKKNVWIYKKSTK